MARHLDAQALRRLKKENTPLIRANPKLAKLRKRLLALGGEEVDFTSGSDLYTELLLERGFATEPKRVDRIPGRRRRCHWNSAVAYLDTYPRCEPYRIVTGWALGNNGLWYRHSWVLDVDGDQICESTFKACIYYGVMLNKDESKDFIRLIFDL